MAPTVAFSGHLGLRGTHPSAPKVPLLHSLATTRLQMVLLVALLGQLGLEGAHPPAARASRPDSSHRGGEGNTRSGKEKTGETRSRRGRVGQNLLHPLPPVNPGGWVRAGGLARPMLVCAGCRRTTGGSLATRASSPSSTSQGSSAHLSTRGLQKPRGSSCGSCPTAPRTVTPCPPRFPGCKGFVQPLRAPPAAPSATLWLPKSAGSALWALPPPLPLLGEVLQAEAEVCFLIDQHRHAWLGLCSVNLRQFWGERRPLPPIGRSGAGGDLPAAV